MNIKRHASEKGQAVIFLVVGLVVFLGFIALAVDGGMAYSDRRHAQNSADSASLAGGAAASIYMEEHNVFYSSWQGGCQNNTSIYNARIQAVQAAIARAAANGFEVDTDPADGSWVETTCGVTNLGYEDRYIDVTVHIQSTTETTFAKLLFPSDLVNRVDATTRVRPRAPLVFGNAVVALNPANCQGQQNGAGFHGSVDIYVDGGGIFSNGCLKGDGGPNVDVINGSVSYVGQVNDPQLFSPAPVQAPSPLPPHSYEIDPPNCGHADAWNGNASQFEGLSPLDPGLYCVSGDVKFNANDEFVGTGVTIVFLDGKVTINGGAMMQLKAPERSPDPSPAVPGLLIYAPPTNHNTIQINGNSESFFTGTVLAAGANIDMSGNGDLDAYQVQLIGWNVEVGGTADAYVTFDDKKNFSRPTNIELSE